MVGGAGSLRVSEKGWGGGGGGWGGMERGGSLEVGAGVEGGMRVVVGGKGVY